MEQKLQENCSKIIQIGQQVNIAWKRQMIAIVSKTLILN